MKFIHTIIIFAIGLMAVFIGGTFKVMHLEGANYFLMTGLVLQVLGALLFVYKLLATTVFKKFTNS